MKKTDKRLGKIEIKWLIGEKKIDRNYLFLKSTHIIFSEKSKKKHS